MFVCLHCGRVFTEDEISVWKEGRGEYWGAPCYESVSGCPSCNGDYVKAHRCDRCDEWIDGPYIKLENDERVCKNCYNTYELGDEE